MNIIKNALYSIIGGKRTIKEPIFTKDFQKYNRQLNDLIDLSKQVNSSKKDLIDRDISLLKYGLDGEQNLYFELKNSFVPMLCLHDIRLEFEDYIAQFDFILITNKSIYILESKKLSGDIKVSSNGDFIRMIKSKYGKILREEGMYSPISQNERHVDILKNILIKEGIIKTFPVKSVVVISNPKTIVFKDDAPENIKSNILKYDQFTTWLKNELSDKKNDRNLLERYMFEISDFLIKNNKPITFNYLDKYSLTKDDFSNKEEKLNSDLHINLDKMLREYRLLRSKEDGIKPYFIFSNKELEYLIMQKPKTEGELLEVKGFGPKKLEKYGKDILDIINRN